MYTVKSILEQQRVKKTNGGEKIVENVASYAWQDEAVRAWQALRLYDSPTPSFFKCFRDDVWRAREALSFVRDAHARDVVKLFYWRFNRLPKTI